MFSIFRYLVSQQFLILFFVFVQASAVKPGICNLFLSYCFLMLSSKRRFSNPAFKNSCSNPYFWGVKTRVSKFGFLNSGFKIRVSKFRGNYSFLNLEIQRSQYIRPKVTVHKGVETIQGRKLFKGGNYMRKYSILFAIILEACDLLKLVMAFCPILVRDMKTT
jgi:hypothetical protein